jgi:hypothetical protein
MHEDLAIASNIGVGVGIGIGIELLKAMRKKNINGLSDVPVKANVLIADIDSDTDPDFFAHALQQ